MRNEDDGLLHEFLKSQDFVLKLIPGGLIKVTKDAQDGRKVIMSLLPAGEAVLEDMYPRAFRISELTVANLNPAERMAFTYLLQKIIDG